ncbi:hypothetical protein ACFV42_23120 [Streptomyces solisilvae]|uniref:hypothetical protein n=1 Tax=Streptomyces malaysiensis TaxID=92644 RepID=UPI00369ACAF4
MPDDTRARTTGWPLGPFLSFPDAAETPDPGSAEPGGPLREPDNAPETLVEKAPDNPKTTGESSQKKTEDPGEATPGKGLLTLLGRRGTEPGPDDNMAREDRPETTTGAEKTDPAPGGVPRAAPAPAANGPEPAGEEDDHGFVARVRRQAALLRQGDRYARRRLLAVKYGAGACIGWGLGVYGWAHDALVYANHNPDNAMCLLAASVGAYTAWSLLGKAQHIVQPVFASIGQLFTGVGRLFHVIPVIGPFSDFVVNTWNAVFSNYVPFRLIASAIGGWFAFPFGIVAVGYAQSKGLDTTAITPHLVGFTATGASWYLIDRRTEAYAQHLPGHAFHWATCTLTGTAALATALYDTP